LAFLSAVGRSALRLLILAAFGSAGCFRVSTVPGSEAPRLAALGRREEVTVQSNVGDRVPVRRGSHVRLHLADGSRLRLPEQVGYGPTSMRLLGPRERGIVVPYDRILSLEVEHLDRAKTARISVLASLGVTAAVILVLLSQLVWE